MHGHPFGPTFEPDATTRTHRTEGSDVERERLARQARSDASVNRSNDISGRRSGRPLRASIHSLLNRMGTLVA